MAAVEPVTVALYCGSQQSVVSVASVSAEHLAVHSVVISLAFDLTVTDGGSYFQVVLSVMLVVVAGADAVVVGVGGVDGADDADDADDVDDAE